MAKNIAVASKFSEEENEKLEIYAKMHNKSKSQVVHELVMQGIKQPVKVDPDSGEVTERPQIASVGFLFLEDFAFFWKDKVYRGILDGEDVQLYFGGEWRHYKLSDLPVRVVE